MSDHEFGGKIWPWFFLFICLFASCLHNLFHLIHIWAVMSITTMIHCFEIPFCDSELFTLFWLKRRLGSVHFCSSNHFITSSILMKTERPILISPFSSQPSYSTLNTLHPPHIFLSLLFHHACASIDQVLEQVWQRDTGSVSHFLIQSLC